MGRAAAIVGLVVLLVGCASVPTQAAATPTGCNTKDGQRAYDLLNQHAQRWDDALKLANSTPRIALAPPVQQLQEIRRQAQAQEWPACAREQQTTMLAMMDAYIDAFLAFMAQQPHEAKMAQANDLATRFVAQMQQLAR